MMIFEMIRTHAYYNTMALRRVLLTVAAAGCMTSAGPAQSGQQRLELGLQLTGVHLHKLHETPYGIGGRVFWNFTPNVSLDTEAVHYPENPSGNFGETSVLCGLKSGRRSERFGIFGKARIGLMHFGGAFYDLRLDKKTFFTTDLGGVVEYYPGPRITIRIDLGDTILFYGSHALFRGPQSPPLETVHNFQPAFGVGFRF